MDCLDIKSECSFQEQSSRSECTSPLDATSNGGIADFRAKIISGQIKLKEKRGRSRVWNMFGTLVDENGDDIEHFVACRSCFNTYKYVNSTSNLVKHKCYLNYEAKENGGMVDVDNETKSKLNDAAAQWLKSAITSHILSVSPLHIQHDSNAVNHMEKAVKKCLRYFACDLDEDHPIIVMDSDENFSTAFNNHHHIHCIVNLLSRTIEKVFREIPELQGLLDTCIENCRKPVAAKRTELPDIR
ncbi:hypothetical protein ACLKA7_010919 [Drosophila subpalustris]